MTNIISSTDPKELELLVDEVHRGENVLPDFQRNFVWKPSFIAQLLNSIRQGYPAGSILRMDFRPNEFSHRFFENVTNENDNPKYLTLDGQQRLTSLHNAIHGVGNYKFFLNVSELIKTNEFLEALYWETSSSKRPIYYSKKDNQTENLPIPFSRLFDDTLLDWIIDTTDKETNDSDQGNHKEKVQKYAKLLQPIQKSFNGYKFPVVCLQKNTSLEAICTIFETINDTGVRLSVFDLLTARFYPRNINLPVIWEEAKGTFPIFKEFDLDPVLILQTVSALVTKGYKLERKDLLSLNANDFDSKWKNACKAFSEVLEMLQQDCGVISKKWLPNSSILVTLSSVVCKISSNSGPIVAENKRTLQRWFWRATIGLYYQNSPTSQIERDIPLLLDWIEKGNESLEENQIYITEDFIFKTTPKQQRAFYKTIMCALVSNKIKDLHRGHEINSNNIKEKKIEDHHVFPLKFLYDKERNGETINRRNIPEEFDNIVNHILIDSTTNKKISASAPSEYFGEISKKQTEELRNDIWNSHLVNSEAFDALINDDFNRFCKVRVNLIRQRLLKLVQ